MNIHKFPSKLRSPLAVPFHICKYFISPHKTSVSSSASYLNHGYSYMLVGYSFFFFLSLKHIAFTQAKSQGKYFTLLVKKTKQMM